MAEPIVFYSTNTLLAFNIAERYYGGYHYVWCTPYFASWSEPTTEFTVPPTSSPREIYINLLKEITGDDQHSANIDRTKIGLRKGAAIKRAAGIINDQQEQDIYAVIDQARNALFKPLIYVIPYTPIKNILSEVPVRERANPLSVEYRIEQLPRDCFDVIEINWR